MSATDRDRFDEDTDGLPENDEEDVAPGDEVDRSTLALFDDDIGQLDLPQRRALIRLLTERYLTPRTHPREWTTLVEHTSLLTSRLHDLLLDLRLDVDRGIAFKTQILLDGDEPTPRILKSRPYSREETIILVYLRQRFRTDRADGADDVVVDRDEIVDHVEGFRSADSTDRKMDRTYVEKSLERLTQMKILYTTGDEDRLRISPVIESLLPMSVMSELMDWLVGRNSDADRPDNHTNDGELNEDDRS